MKPMLMTNWMPKHTFRMKVNGEELDEIHYIQTGHFHKFQAYEVELDLKAGENTITIFGYAKGDNKGDTEWMPNFDYIIIPEVTKQIEVRIAAISIE